jgi:hypothetical protein
MRLRVGRTRRAQLKADVLAAAGDRDGAPAARREAEAMTRRLIPPDLDLSWVR